MAAFTKANDWVEYESEVADLDNDQFVLALSNTAPASETNNPLTDTKGVLANVTQISYTNLSTRNLTRVASVQTGGTYKRDVIEIKLIRSVMYMSTMTPSLVIPLWVFTIL